MNVLPSNLIVPPRTLTGRGRLAALLPEASRFGPRGILVHGRSSSVSGVTERVLSKIPPGASVKCWRHSGGEPTLGQVDELLEAVRSHDASWVAGIGGGSVMDLAKAAAGLRHARRAPAAYHDGAALERPGIPFIAAPTTAGTGAEATLNSVLTNERTGQKKSIRDDSLMPRLVILDADLLATCPPDVVAASGLDALTQAVEAFTSRHATWLSDQLALRGLGLIAANVESVFAGARDTAADELLTGSYLAGLALSMARLGVVHGLAHPLGTRYHAAHGIVCAVCLPLAIEMNRATVGPKYDAMSRAAGGDLLARTRQLLDRLAIRSPFQGQALTDREGIVAETLASGSTAANPKAVSAEDVEELLRRLFEA